MSLISLASEDFFPLASSHFFKAAFIVVGMIWLVVEKNQNEQDRLFT